MSSSPRQTTDPLPLPASPAKTDTLVPARGGGGDAAAANASGIPFAGQAGIAEADADAADRRHAAGARPASADGPAQATPATDGAAPVQPAGTAGADGPPGHVDGLLESLGKAISSPIRGAAEDEEPA